MNPQRHCIAYLVGRTACNCWKCTHEDCQHKNTVTEIEAESQGRGSPPLYRCLDCGAQWGRD